MPTLPFEVRPRFLAHFAIDVLLHTSSGDLPAIKGIFDLEPTGGPSSFTGRDDSAPEVLVNDADLPSELRIGCGATIDGTRYRIHSIRPDGTGFTLLKLSAPGVR